MAIIEHKVKETLGKAGEVMTKYAPGVVEYMATEKFPKLVRNVVFAVMVGVMTYTMIRLFTPIASNAEYVAGQWASFMGTMITLIIPIMVFFLVFAIIKAIVKWVAG